MEHIKKPRLSHIEANDDITDDISPYESDHERNYEETQTLSVEVTAHRSIREQNYEGVASSNSIDDMAFQERLDSVENIITSYRNEFDILDDRKRRQLFDDITFKCFLNQDILLTNPQIQYIANRISVIFVEDSDIYYNEQNGKVSGKLYHRYHNNLKKMRKNSLIAPSNRALNKLRKTTEADIYVISEDENNSIDYLLRDKLDSVSDVANHWNATFAYRRNLLKDTDRVLTDILSQWQCLKFSFSHALICGDFAKMYGLDCATSLRKNWNIFFDAKKIEILRLKVKDPATLSTMRNQPNVNEYMSVSVVFYLNAILCPPLKQKGYRPSIKNAQDSVLILASSEADVKKELDRLAEFWKRYAIEPHPVIFYLECAEGQIKIILILHDIRYEFIKFSDCMDVCFKLYLTFNMNFPFESMQFFQLLNEIFYKIDLKKSKSSKILSLLQNLN